MFLVLFSNAALWKNRMVMFRLRDSVRLYGNALLLNACVQLVRKKQAKKLLSFESIKEIVLLVRQHNNKQLIIIYANFEKRQYFIKFSLKIRSTKGNMSLVSAHFFHCFCSFSQPLPFKSIYSALSLSSPFTHQ